MWKFVSRRFRETFERSANHFERSTTNVVNTTNNINEENKRSGPPCRWLAASRRCWGSFRCDKKDTNSKKWNFDHLNRSWIGAITWSGAIVFGWYAGQIIHLKLKKHQQLKDPKKYASINNIIAILQPYVAGSGPNRDITIKPSAKVESILENFTPTVHLITNEHSGSQEGSSSAKISSNSSSSDDLGDVLNSIENRLGLAAIERGQHDIGLNLLRSAANRHHAPALFNLGLCYEAGMGVPVDEKTAMEFYKSAASLEHPGALYNLGIYYGQGRGGLERDKEMATRLLRLAAVQGQQDAIDALKTLQIDLVPFHTEDDAWASRHNLLPHNDSVIPTPSVLFVENLVFTKHAEASTVF